ncbi:MAG TPA: hypothetical protein VER96_03215 [Polyangiaceae bacterium]|nr:hypothetical protein [Polyangiaceae bacterium]
MRRATISQLTSVLALAWSTLLGCAQIAGTADYEVLQEPKADPALPFLTGTHECDACAADKCGGELAVCEADEVCSSWLADIRSRPNPLAAYDRYKTESELLWQVQHDPPVASWDALYNLKDCAGKCLDVCRTGQDFACVGGFEWDLPQPTFLRTRIADFGTAVSARVFACLGADQCDEPLSSETTDDAGFAELRIDAEQNLRGPVGYFRILGDEKHAIPWQYSQTRPLGENDYTAVGVLNDGVVRSWVESFGVALDGDHGALMILPVDCAGNSSKEVSLEAWTYVGNELTPCEDCAYAYAKDKESELPSKDLNGFITTGRTGYIGNVPTGLVTILLRRLTKPNDVVSVARLVVRGGEMAVLKPYPASAADLLSFTDPKN